MSDCMAPAYGQLGSTQTGSDAWMKIWRSRDDEMPLCEPLPLDAEPDPYDADTEIYVQLAIRFFRKKLKRTEFGVIYDRFFGGRTLKEIADRLLVTNERIRQIEIKAIRKLRLAMRDAELKAIEENANRVGTMELRCDDCGIVYASALPNGKYRSRCSSCNSAFYRRGMKSK